MVNIVTGDGARGRGAGALRASTRSRSPARPRSARRSSARWPGRGTGLTLELGGKSANIVFEDAALDQAVEGIIEGIFFNQGHVCCAGSRLLLQESVAEEVVRKLWARMERLRVGDPLDKNTDVGAINSAAQLARIEALVDEGEREGATRRSIACALPETGYWFPPTLFLDVAPANRIAVEEIFGPVVSVTTFRTPAEAVERANNSAYGLAAGVWTDNGSKAFEVASRAARRRRLAEHLQPLRPDGRVRRLQGERLRPRGRPGRPAAVREADVSRRALVAKTYKLYLGGAFVRSESGRSDPTDARRRRQRPARLAQGRARRGQGRARRAGGLGGRTAYNRGQVLYRFAEALESRSDELARRRAAGPRRRARELGAAVDLLVHYAGWTDKLAAVMGGINPVAAPYLSLLRPRADRRRRRARARRARPARAWSARSRPALAAGNTVVALVSRRWPLRALDLGEVAGVSDVPGGVLNLLSGRHRRAARRRCAATATSTRSSTPPATPSARGDRRARRRDRQARRRARRRRRATRSRGSRR